MNDRLTIKNHDARPDVDVVLGEFFRAEMPAPWPTLQVPHQARPRRGTSFWSQSSGRLALAACIALLLAGYIALSGYFPRRANESGMQDIHPHIGQGHQKGAAPVVPNND